MPIRLHSLRTRLTLLYALIFGLLQSGFWITVDVVRTNLLYQHFDEELLGNARSVMAAIESASENTIPFLRARFQEDALEQFAAEALYIQVTVGSGEIIGQTKNLTGVRLPISKKAIRDAAKGIPSFDTITGGATAAVSGAGSKLRAVVLCHNAGDDKSILLQVAADLQPVTDIVNQLRRFIVVFFIVSLTLCILTSWYMVGRSLAPVGRIVRQAKRITASRLHERISVPKGSDEIRDMVLVLNEMLDRLQAQFRNQRQFLSNVSHELKTPITILLNEARDRSRELDSVESKEFAQTVRSEAERLLRIVDAFLLLTRVGSGGSLSIRVQTPLEDIVLKAMKACEADASAKSVRLIPLLSYDDSSIDPSISGDSDLLYSMLENIVRNAVRHSPEGGSVEIEAVARTREASLHVRDQGPGLPPEQIQKVFEPFYQIKSDTQQENTGLLGIGLSISKAIAELHGGTIIPKNRPQGGSEFVIRLPILPDAAPLS